jgi:hypothetical protein
MRRMREHAWWTFQPGRVNGEPVRTHMQVPIIYTLNAGTPP